ncbi:RNA polymerase sigma factor, sigma-70 family [Alkalispirochaeta americana]|uniref:RNA polymerase sigma factor, sigma-70 family n=1 Tax=Alkalispirochaeta americana TaxID=159291 RepID=A0A1N6NWE0_9SPIO|nr:hypothetical protein [Alkalispirochaeta americana]SIP96448.1 RNA polymerase sigma factor, sigma-70 family [Alkalispirochaeta americana]
MKSLDQYYRGYQSQTISWDRFVAEALKFMRRVLGKRHRLDTEEMEEIIADFYPRLVKMAETYQDQGASFEGYLATTLYHSSREYMRKKIDHRNCHVYLSESSGSVSSIPELVSEMDQTIHYGTHRPEIIRLQGAGTEEALKKQLLYLFCKNVPLLSLQDCQSFSHIFDLPLSWMTAIGEYCRHHRADRAQRRTIFQERRDKHYSAMLHFERELQEEFYPPIREKLKRRSNHHRKLWLLYIQRLKKQNIHLSNKEVALLLGVPKGTVDSSLHNLSKRLASSLATQ